MKASFSVAREKLLISKTIPVSFVITKMKRWK